MTGTCPRCTGYLPHGQTGLCGGCEADAALTYDSARPWVETNRALCALLHRGLQPTPDPRYARAEAEVDALVQRCPVTPDPAPHWVSGWV
jgi:hypothetical protein